VSDLFSNAIEKPGRPARVRTRAAAVRRAFAFGLAFAFAFVTDAAYALPTGGEVSAGTATIQQSAGAMTVNQASDRAAINWLGFGIGAGESVRFNQPSSSSIMLNRVLGQDPSAIFGSLSANGRVFILNPNGVLFAPGARVDVGGLVASSLQLSDADFLAGRYTLAQGASAAPVVNQGDITAASGGYVVLAGPQVRNEGTISAPDGTAALAAGGQVTLNIIGGSLVGVAVDRGALDALAENRQIIRAQGGQVLLSAKAADQLARAAVNNDGVIEASSLVAANGVIRLEGGTVTNSGSLRADGGNAAEGGSISVQGDFVGLGGTVSADGARGGQISVSSQGNLSLADRVSARGTAGAGGSITYRAGGALIESATSRSDVSGATDGGAIRVQADEGILSSGTYLAQGQAGAGGAIDLSGYSVRLLSAQIDASGATRGGLVRVGGAFQGGKTVDTTAPWYESFVGRWGDRPAIANSTNTFVNDGSRIDVSSGLGSGGTAVVWSDQQTTMLGAIDARGAAGGGSVEISSAGTLQYASLDRVSVGAGGYLLLDPANITIGSVTDVLNWSLAAVVGSGFTPGTTKTTGVSTLGAGDLFGNSVALNGAGDRLAVGAPGDAGSANGAGANTGAVYLFSFTDTSFSGATLQSTIGKGYTGGKNVNVSSLAAGDLFGSSVALNSTGDRLAVGAPGDAGAADTTGADTGAVYLFSFGDTSFSGGTQQATIGSGYTGGKDLSVAALQAGDRFGRAVSLDAAGDRLAVGAPGDAGNSNNFAGAGAAYLLTFSDTNFSGGALAGTTGKGYNGGKNVNINLGSGDAYGTSVALNAAGDRLAVGAPGDSTGAGAAYLFTFTDTSFTGGANPVTLGTAGAGRTTVVGLESGDAFGSSVTLNAFSGAGGNLLTVGAPGDDGSGVASTTPNNYGAAYLYSFANNSFGTPALQGTIGSGYTGGKNFGITLDTNDAFGSAVALNSAGNRLAAGASGDAGSANGSGANTGAVNLFTFTDTAFSGGARAATIGSGYAGGSDLNVAGLDSGDNFGGSIALNAAGDRMAVGARHDAGAANGQVDAGAVYLFSFSDTNFGGAALQSTIGYGYAGGKNVNVSGMLAAGDSLGRSVALSADGTLLASGAHLDDGASDGVTDSGAVYLFKFTDTSFSGGTVTGRIGNGYVGANDYNLSSLVANDNFGWSVALNARGDRLAVGATGDSGGNGAVYLFTFADTSFSSPSLVSKVLSGTATAQTGVNFGSALALDALGDRMAVGARYDSGSTSSVSGAGAVYLFSFADTSFGGLTYQGTIGSGYSGGKNVSVALEQDDNLGRSVALNAAGDRLAVGAPGDDGSGIAYTALNDYGAVYLFSFSDTSFSNGTLTSTLGSGYTGGKNVNVSALALGDSFGRGVALNAAGNRLAVGAPADAGMATGTGAAYLFTSVLESGAASPSAQTYAAFIGQSVTVRPGDIALLLGQGTAVTLQASNDITLSAALVADPVSASSGTLTLQAGRSILLNANVTTGNGNLNLYANDLLANGVVDADRAAGSATVTMGAATSINAGTGAVSIDLRDGTGKTNTASGDISLGSITAGSITAVNNGLSAGNVVLNAGATLSASGTGNAITLAAASGGNFVNNSGAGALSAPAGRWLVYSKDPSLDTRGGLAYDFKRYNCTYAGGCFTVGTSIPAAGNGLIYSIAPTLTIAADPKTITYGDLEAPLTFSASGFIDGDTAGTALSGALSRPFGAVSSSFNEVVGTYAIGQGTPFTSPMGYQIVSFTGANYVINPYALSVTFTAANRVYDGTTAANVSTSYMPIGADSVIVNYTSATFVDKNVGTAKPVTVNGVSLTGLDAANYSVAATGGASADITAAALTVTAQTDNRVYDGTTGSAGGDGHDLRHGHDRHGGHAELRHEERGHGQDAERLGAGDERRQRRGELCDHVRAQCGQRGDHGAGDHGERGDRQPGL